MESEPIHKKEEKKKKWEKGNKNERDDSDFDKIYFLRGTHYRKYTLKN